MDPVVAQLRAVRALAAIRIVVSGIMVTHGCYRALTDGFVPGFGGFLSEQGLPAGTAIATAITAWEILGGAVLAAGRLVRPLALGFVLELAAGIALVHAREGWFVVGGGRNGMEFSVLLIGCFAAIAWAGGTPARHAATASPPRAAA
jgi:putative oxidoreductase